MMIPQLATNRLAEVLQKDIDEFTGRLDKGLVALTKIMKSKTEDVNRKSVIPLRTKVEALAEEYTNYTIWAERFGVGTAKPAKRARKTR